MRNGNGNVRIYSWEEAKLLVGFVRLTKWLPGLHDDMSYLRKEYTRISADPSRMCAIVTCNSKYALFVNDVTNGEFDKMKEADDE